MPIGPENIDLYNKLRYFVNEGVYPAVRDTVPMWKDTREAARYIAPAWRSDPRWLEAARYAGPTVRTVSRSNPLTMALALLAGDYMDPNEAGVADEYERYMAKRGMMRTMSDRQSYMPLRKVYANIPSPNYQTLDYLDPDLQSRSYDRDYTPVY